MSQQPLIDHSKSPSKLSSGDTKLGKLKLQNQSTWNSTISQSASQTYKYLKKLKNRERYPVSFYDSEKGQQISAVPLNWYDGENQKCIHYLQLNNVRTKQELQRDLAASAASNQQNNQQLNDKQDQVKFEKLIKVDFSDEQIGPEDQQLPFGLEDHVYSMQIVSCKNGGYLFARCANSLKVSKIVEKEVSPFKKMSAYDKDIIEVELREQTIKSGAWIMHIDVDDQFVTVFVQDGISALSKIQIDISFTQIKKVGSYVVVSEAADDGSDQKFNIKFYVNADNINQMICLNESSDKKKCFIQLIDKQTMEQKDKSEIMEVWHPYTAMQCHSGRLYLGADNGQIDIYQVSPFQFLTKLGKGNDKPIQTLYFHDNLMFSGYEGTILVWKLPKEKQMVRVDNKLKDQSKLLTALMSLFQYKMATQYKVIRKLYVEGIVRSIHMDSNQTMTVLSNDRMFVIDQCKFQRQNYQHREHQMTSTNWVFLNDDETAGNDDDNFMYDEPFEIIVGCEDNKLRQICSSATKYDCREKTFDGRIQTILKSNGNNKNNSQFNKNENARDTTQLFVLVIDQDQTLSADLQSKSHVCVMEKNIDEPKKQEIPCPEGANEIKDILLLDHQVDKYQKDQQLILVCDNGFQVYRDLHSIDSASDNSQAQQQWQVHKQYIESGNHEAFNNVNFLVNQSIYVVGLNGLNKQVRLQLLKTIDPQDYEILKALEAKIDIVWHINEFKDSIDEDQFKDFVYVVLEQLHWNIQFNDELFHEQMEKLKEQKSGFINNLMGSNDTFGKVEIQQFIIDHFLSKGMYEIGELYTELRGQLSNIAVSDPNIMDQYRFLAVGDEKGNINIWRECNYKGVFNLKINSPCAVKNYHTEGQCLDLVFLQNNFKQEGKYRVENQEQSKVELLLSLHYSEKSKQSYLILTSLFKFTVITKIPINFKASKIILQTNMLTQSQTGDLKLKVFLIPSLDSQNVDDFDSVEIDLGFERFSQNNKYLSKSRRSSMKKNQSAFTFSLIDKSYQSPKSPPQKQKQLSKSLLYSKSQLNAQRKQRKRQNLSDLSLQQLLNGSCDDWKNFEILLGGLFFPLGLIDPINKINLLNVLSTLNSQSIHDMQLIDILVSKQIPYISDVDHQSLANRFMASLDIQNLHTLFSYIYSQDKHMLQSQNDALTSNFDYNIKIDRGLLFYAVKYEPSWIMDKADDDLFKEPRFWGTKKEFIQFGKIKDGQSMVMFKSFTNNCSLEMLEKYVDFDTTSKKDQNQLRILVSTCPLNIEMGTRQSNEFLRAVQGAEDESFNTRFHWFIKYKFTHEKVFLQPMVLLNVFYVIVINIYAVIFKTIPSQTYLTFIQILNILLCFYEIAQCWSDNKYKNGRKYVYDFTNYFDVLGLYLMMNYAFQVQNKSVEDSNLHRNWLFYSIFIGNIRVMFQLGVFQDSFRQMVTIITSAFCQLAPFLVVLYYLIGMMAICNYTIITKGTDDDFFESLFSIYQIMFGVNPMYDVVSRTGPTIFLYFFSSNFIVIICLNILISIVTEKYEEVMLNINAIDYKQQAELLEKNEKIFFHDELDVESYFFVIMNANDLIETKKNRQQQSRTIAKMAQNVEQMADDIHYIRQNVDQQRGVQKQLGGGGVKQLIRQQDGSTLMGQFRKGFLMKYGKKFEEIDGGDREKGGQVDNKQLIAQMREHVDAVKESLMEQLNSQQKFMEQIYQQQQQILNNSPADPNNIQKSNGKANKAAQRGSPEEPKSGNKKFKKVDG